MLLFVVVIIIAGRTLRKWMNELKKRRKEKRFTKAHVALLKRKLLIGISFS